VNQDARGLRYVGTIELIKRNGHDSSFVGFDV
jgi:hypothetical protein